ncbi:single-stranded DNA-binding protein [Leisingera aquaemixtae]|uniref:single-stranded DNA-binding protein n=1 Tax=Leisingera aquaemixtae TaxID=1396826 RepID=UPI001ABFCF99
MVVFGKVAENCARYLHKGALVMVEGRMGCSQRPLVFQYRRNAAIVLWKSAMFQQTFAPSRINQCRSLAHASWVGSQLSNHARQFSTVC